MSEILNETCLHGMIPLNVECNNNEMNYIRDIEYIKRGNESLYIQLILPDKKETPLIVYVTGSAFKKQNIPQTLPRLCLLANMGYAVASVQHRGSETAAFPAQILDVKAAVRFLRFHAGEYGYDADRIFLMGDSSGGYIALMAGFTADTNEFQEEIYSEAGSGVKGIIDLYGPVDFIQMPDKDKLPDSPHGELIGHKNLLENPELAEPAIVTNYISEEKKIPPVLIFHGTDDKIMPIKQSCILHEKLCECKKKAYFYSVEGAGHGGKEFWSDEILDYVNKFIR